MCTLFLGSMSAAQTSAQPTGQQTSAGGSGQTSAGQVDNGGDKTSAKVICTAENECCTGDKAGPKGGTATSSDQSTSATNNGTQETVMSNPGSDNAGEGKANCYMSILRAVNRKKRFYKAGDDEAQYIVHGPGMGVVTFSDCISASLHMHCQEVQIACGYGAGGPEQVTMCICEPVQVGGPGVGGPSGNGGNQVAPFRFMAQIQDHPNGNPLVFESTRSGSQMWWHFATDPQEFIEVRHFDGTIARYDYTSATVTRPDTTAVGRFWQLTSVLDPYDNKTTYSYTNTRLNTVTYPNGLEAHWNWFPSWISNWGAGHSGIEVTYEHNGAVLPGLNWAMVFEDVLEGGINHRWFNGLMVARFAQAATMVDDAAPGQLYDIATASSKVEVTEFVYGTGVSEHDVVQVQKYWWPAGQAPAPAPTATYPRIPTLSTTYYQVGPNINKVESQTHDQLGLTTQYAYDTDGPTYAGTLPSGASLSTTRITGPHGDSEIREFDPVSGRVYRTIIDPGTDGRPRAAEGNFGIAGYPFAEEPERMAIDQHFNGTCVCQKPIKIESGPVDAGGSFTGVTRITEFTYDPVTNMVLTVVTPNPSTGTGEPATVTQTYEYHTEPGPWSPRWIKRITAVDGTVTELDYHYKEPRANGQHGYMQGMVSSTTKNVGILTTNSTTVAQADVSELVYYNLPNIGTVGPAYSGPATTFPRGQIRRVIDDGVTSTYLYDTTHGGLSSTYAAGLTDTLQSTFTYDVWGRLSATSSNVGTPYQTDFTVTQDAYHRTEHVQSVAISSVESQNFFDRWGNLAVSMRKNKDSSGQSPKAHGAASSSAREWIRTENVWQHTQLVETRVDRRPVDEGDANPFAGTNPLMAVTSYEHGQNFVKITASNGAITEHRFDGYGSLFKTVIHQSSQANAPTLETSRTYLNDLLEPIATVAGRPSAGIDQTRWLVLERNSAGAVTASIEPLAPASSAPPGYAGSLGGARHEFEIDRLGRTVARRVVTAAGGAALYSAAYHYDELGRNRLTETHLLDATGAITDTHWSANAYKSGRASQRDWTQQVNGPRVNYFYDDVGRLTKAGDAGGSGNRTEYFYKASTLLLDKTVKTLLNPTGPATAYTTSYDYDVLGRQIEKVEGAGTRLPRKHRYAYTSLGLVDTYTAPAVNPETYLHDAMGRTVEHVKLGAGSEFIRNAAAYFDAGLPDSRTRVERYDGLSVNDQDHKTVSHFDFAGRLFAEQTPGADYANEPTASSPNKAYSTFLAHDDLSNVTNQYDGDGGNIAFHYDGLGRMLQRELLTAQPNIATFNTKDVFLRDALGRVSQTSMFGAINGGAAPGTALTNSSSVGSQQTDYDSLGRLLEERSLYLLPTNVTTVRSSYAGPDAFRTGLSIIDNLTGNVSQPLDLIYTPDTQRRIQSIDWDRTPGTSSNVQHLASYGWRGGERVTRDVTYSSGVSAATDYAHDALGRLTMIEDKIGTTVTNRFDYAYDLANNLKKEEYAKIGGRAGDRFTYDSFNRLKESYLGVSANLMAQRTDPVGYAPAETDRKVTYTLDAAHNRESVLTEKGASSILYPYDLEDGTNGFEPSNRYTTAHGSLVHYDNRGNMVFDGQNYYSYDPFNRLQLVLRVALGGEESTQSAATNDPDANTKARYAPLEGIRALDDSRKGIYDEVSNLLHRLPREHKDAAFRARLRHPIPGGVIKVVQAKNDSGMSGGGMPSIVQSASLELVALFGYDTHNRRVLRVAVNEGTYVSTYDGWRNVQRGVFNLATFKVEPDLQYAHGNSLDEVLAFRKRTGSPQAYSWETHFVQHGGQDTSAALFDEQGTKQEQYQYDPNGAVTMFTGAGVQTPLSQGVGFHRLYKGLELDTGTSLYYMRNRFYSHVHGRFMSRDPIGEWGDPLNGGNAYAYVGIRPLTNGDPLGLQGQVPTNPGTATGPTPVEIEIDRLHNDWKQIKSLKDKLNKEIEGIKASIANAESQIEPSQAISERFGKIAAVLGGTSAYFDYFSNVCTKVPNGHAKAGAAYFKAMSWAFKLAGTASTCAYKDARDAAFIHARTAKQGHKLLRQVQQASIMAEIAMITVEIDIELLKRDN